MGSFYVDCATKNSEKYVVSLCYSPCDDTPTDVIVAVTTGGVSLLILKKIFFFVSLLPLEVHGGSDTPQI